ncbi:hypothetical protein [Xanthomonas axonopodis]|uniref:hypothetical protein n=2 Tax=Xanthomonas axonopodis TaxID=53413 RepID=UPI0015C31C56
MDSGEALRAEWVMRVSALDLYIHELISIRLVRIFQGVLRVPRGFGNLRLKAETAIRLAAASPMDRDGGFDLDVRTQLSFSTFQMPDKIADGIRLTSEVDLWSSLAKYLHPDEHPSKYKNLAKGLKDDLTAIIERRNKIAHEGDLQPGMPREVWFIDIAQLETVKCFLYKLVTAIEAVVWAYDLTQSTAQSVAAGVEHPQAEPTLPAFAIEIPEISTNNLAVLPDVVQGSHPSGALCLSESTATETRHMPARDIDEENFNSHSRLRGAQSPTTEVHISSSPVAIPEGRLEASD